MNEQTYKHRCTTSCLLCFLSSVYPQWAIMFQSLIALDFASHYIHMYSSMVAGSKSHKTVSKKQSRILHSYYTNSEMSYFFPLVRSTFIERNPNQFWIIVIIKDDDYYYKFNHFTCLLLSLLSQYVLVNKSLILFSFGKLRNLLLNLISKIVGNLVRNRLLN
ncbi:hypothetical protein PSHT_11258, partial [Puccinia striiformis]